MSYNKPSRRLAIVGMSKAVIEVSDTRLIAKAAVNEHEVIQ